jgi:hypothetical protein
VSEEPQSGADSAGEEEVLDGVPVLVEQPRIVARRAEESTGALERSATGVIPAVQAAAVAAGGFVAGAAVVGLVHRRHQRSLLAKGRRGTNKLGRGGGTRRSGRAGELVQIVSSRSLLLDVHLLGGADADR